jgi:hypothetical protein
LPAAQRRRWRPALHEEAIAILPYPVVGLPAGLRAVHVLRNDAGRPIAVAVGRIAPEDAAPDKGWTPCSWRRRNILQMPLYPDAAALRAVEAELDARAPRGGDLRCGRAQAAMAAVARGDGFLVQGGDCAESFAACGAIASGRIAPALLELGQ